MKIENTYKYPSMLDIYDKYVRVYLLFNHITLQEQVINILIYFINFGVTKKAEDFLLTHKVIKNSQQISNAKTLLHRNGLLIKKGKGDWDIIDSLKTKPGNSIEFNIKISK